MTMDEVIAKGRAKARELGLLREPGDPPKPPGLLRRAGNFAVAATRHVLAGLPVVSDEEKERRLGICRECPNFTAAETCAVCTCPMKRKAAWALEHCPLPTPKW